MHRNAHLLAGILVILGCGGAVNLPPETNTVFESLEISPSRLTGGGISSGKVTLLDPAPQGGAKISLSTNANAVSVPDEVEIAEGGLSGSFSIDTQSVLTRTTYQVTVSYEGSSRSASITLTP